MQKAGINCASAQLKLNLIKQPTRQYITSTPLFAIQCYKPFLFQIMEVTYYQFCKTIADDFKIELNQKHKTKFSEFPVKNGRRKISSFYDSTIVDANGNEYPYMLNQSMRNEEKLVDFDHIYFIRPKNLNQILNETGIKLRSEKCKICEGGGWYSQGIRYFYRDISCEV